MDKIKLTNLKKQMDIVGREVIKELIDQLIHLDKKATGALINSLEYEVVEVLNDVFLNIYSLDYLDYLDKGRKPGKMPPSQSFIPWIRARGIKIKNWTDEQSAFVIARSVGKKGIKPLNFKKKMTDNILSRKSQLIAEGVTMDIQEALHKIIENIK
jgi:hypothetical protein